MHVTFNPNTPDAIDIASAQTVTTYGSIYTINAGETCGSTLKPTDLGYNVDSGNTCAFTGTGSLPNTNPLGSGSLNNQGGETDVFTIAAGGPAEDLVASCQSTHDQRNFRRVLSRPTAVTRGPTRSRSSPTRTRRRHRHRHRHLRRRRRPFRDADARADAGLQPDRGRRAGARHRAGQGAGSTRFVALTGADGIPFGSTIDTRKGRVELTSLPRRGGTPQKAQFFDGLFKVVQKGGVTELQLSEALDCRSRRASAAQKKPKTRKLWGDGKGKFRTKGRYAPPRSAARVARPGHLHDHAGARHTGQRAGPRRGQAQEHRGAQGQALHRTRRGGNPTTPVARAVRYRVRALDAMLRADEVALAGSCWRS